MIAQQKPPRNAVANIISTDLANTVRIHDRENGNDISVSSRLRPYFIAKPPNMPPKRAPFFVEIANVVTENLLTFKQNTFT